MRRLLTLSIFVVACGTSPAPTCPAGMLVIVETPDFSASGVGILPLDGTPAVLSFGADLGADPALASSAGRRFFVARDRDTIFELDSCGTSFAQFSARAVGELNVDPQDVAVGPDGSLWIARWNDGVPSLLVTPATAGAGPVQTIDMSAFDADGNPDMSSVRIVGNRAFCALDRLTADVSQQASQIAVLDTETRTLVKTITLGGRNPFGTMVESNGMLWLAEPGNFSDAAEATAGIEVVDTTAMTSVLVLPETSLGGSVVEVAVLGTCGAAIIADATPNVNRTSLISFSLDGAIVHASVPAIAPTDGFDLRGLSWAPATSTSQARLLVGDKRAGAVDAAYPVHVFTVSETCSLTPGADLSLPQMPALAFSN